MYRFEFFNPKKGENTAAFFADTASVQIEVDYLSPKTFTVEGPADCGVEYGNTCAIYEGTDLVGAFSVKEVRRRKYGTTITLMHPLQLFNHKSKMVVRSDWRSQMYSQIRNDYMVATNTSVYPLPILFKQVLGTSWKKPQTFGEVIQTATWDAILRRKTYGFFLGFGIETAKSDLGKITWWFEPDKATKTAEINLENIISKEITEDKSARPNIAVIWTETKGRWTAILLDGEIIYSGQRKEEIEVPVVTAKQVKDETTWDEAVKIFQQLLQPQNDGLQIIIQVRKNDRIFTTHNIGDKYHLIDNGRTYDTILTGWRISGNILELKFGTARLSLTEKLNGGNTND